MRRSVAILLALVVVVAMGGAVWRYVDPRGGADSFVLSTVHGDVQLHNESVAREARVGEPIRTGDQLQTGDGRAVLSMDGGTRVRIGPASSVVVRHVDAEGVDLELEDGALKATVRPGGGSVDVTGGGVTVAATDADFAIGVDADIAVVETTRGEVALMGADQPRLGEGSRATIRERTVAIGPIPESLLLEVDWPEPERTRAESSSVRGRTSPGARVTLRGTFGTREVVADAKGVFELAVPLGEGENTVVVRAVDILGEETDVRGVLQTRDTRGPTFQGGVEYGN